jgi:lipoate synthase
VITSDYRRDEVKAGGSIICLIPIKAVKALNRNYNIRNPDPDFKGQKEKTYNALLMRLRSSIATLLKP